ncbi:serine protease inhibitor ecotin [Candidatus Schmidhempelia bombi]|jgi:ecotin|uniref:Serine protease inhibitor ecotin n=1 Tax=Candidatus Schmidhempelia bombi str. Bimp TaxID=1387197 RepID=A0AB94IEU5_9GAMM|nr:serine protease inhibitor ecotin [Candidatus Schmidhempelia bombi]TEA28033.1 serine protease inhibitor ecotin [Candidatus Schmidhempelia bombi str. Bimp]
MKKILVVALSCCVLAACHHAPSTTPEVKEVNQIAPYPEAKPGFTRSVIYLPKLANEANSKIELVIGKELTTDCNARSLSGKIKQLTLDGWGYDYYVVESSNTTISTLMACPASTEKPKFVAINSDLGLINYNSRLPIVIYAPSDMQVKYRVWSTTNGELKAVNQ